MKSTEAFVALFDAIMDEVLASDRYKAFIEREQEFARSRERERIARAIEADMNHDAVRNATLATAARIARLGGDR